MQEALGAFPHVAMLFTKVLLRSVVGVTENICEGVPICNAIPLDIARPSLVRVLFWKVKCSG